MSDKLVVRIGGSAIGLDVLGGDKAYISHAHTDHSAAVGGPLPIFCSDATADLLGLAPLGLAPEPSAPVSAPPEARASGTSAAGSGPPSPLDALLAPRLPDAAALATPEALAKRKARRVRRAKNNISTRMPTPRGIELHPAGHILGSTQLVGESEAWGRVVYTGDFKLRDGLTVKGAPVIQCDTLISECTYGDPGLSFPDPSDVLSDMERWARQNRDAILLWGGYSTGKAQELVKFLNDYMGIEPVVSPRIAQVCAHYTRHGVPLRCIDSTTPEAQEVMRDAFSGVLAPHLLNAELANRLSLVHRRKTLSAVATGWAMVHRLSHSAAFPLSDHADYNEILEYAHACKAKRVFLAHGDNERTAKALRASGLEAQPIERMGEGVQTVLECDGREVSPAQGRLEEQTAIARAKPPEGI